MSAGGLEELAAVLEGRQPPGWIGRRQQHALVAARLVTRGVCVCLCVCGLLELIAKAMTSHPSGSSRCFEYEWARQ
jgi:hypothetical protein